MIRMLHFRTANLTLLGAFPAVRPAADHPRFQAAEQAAAVALLPQADQVAAAGPLVVAALPAPAPSVELKRVVGRTKMRARTQLNLRLSSKFCPAYYGSE